jgi:hypothetical protein
MLRGQEVTALEIARSHLCDRGALSDKLTNPDIRFFPVRYGILSFLAT